MADKPAKSKLPEFGEITKWAGMLASDLKNSVCKIIDDYKANHGDKTTASKNDPSRKKTTTENKGNKDNKAE